MSLANQSLPLQWEDFMPYNVFIRLAQCQTVKSDVPILTKTLWLYEHYKAKKEGLKASYTKAEALDDVIELLCANGLEDITAFTDEEYSNILKEIE